MMKLELALVIAMTIGVLMTTLGQMGAYTGSPGPWTLSPGGTTGTRGPVTDPDEAFASRPVQASFSPSGVPVSRPCPPIGAEGSRAPIWKKSGARTGELGPQIRGIMALVADSFRKKDAPRPVITAATDGQHMANSRHYDGLAVDLRANNMPDAKARAITEDLKRSLGSRYDVIFESSRSNPSNDHIHLEFDPS